MRSRYLAAAYPRPDVCSLCRNRVKGNRTGAPRSSKRTPDFLSSLLALANFIRLSLMKAVHAAVGGAPCRKSGYVGRKRWAKPNDRFRRIDWRIHLTRFRKTE